MVTHIDGLAFSVPNGGGSGREWRISSLARRSIPLVCKHWYSIGLELLFERIVLVDSRQITRLIETLLEHRSSRRASWIIGLELVSAIDPSNEPILLELMHSLISLLPYDQLSLFGVEMLHVENIPARENLTRMIRRLFRRQRAIQVLHIPTINRYMRIENIFDKENLLDDDSGPLFPNLHTLSLIDGRWSNPMPRLQPVGSLRSLHQFSSSLRTLFVDWDKMPVTLEEVTFFLVGLNSLTYLHIGQGAFRYFMVDFFEFCLSSLQSLQTLSLSAYCLPWPDMPDPTPKLKASHPSLREVRMRLEYSNSHKNITDFVPLFKKIELGQLPVLERVVLVSNQYPEGCIDAFRILSAKYKRHWRHAISVCRKARVAFVSQKGEEIGLWADRHDIPAARHEGTSQESGEDNEGNIEDAHDSESEEEQSEDEDVVWYEVDEDEPSHLTESVHEGSAISNDSEDAAYEYEYQPDLDYDDPDESDAESFASDV